MSDQQPKQSMSAKEAADAAKGTAKEPTEEEIKKMAEAQGMVDVTSYKLQKIEEYGQKIEVGGKKMNVYVAGKGTIPLVVFPGLGEISARWSYKNLLDRLGDKYKLNVVEPLGYGLSDQTDSPRTVENTSKEIHTALSKLGLKDYHILAHSMGGMYALQYVNDYRNEVASFIGMDTSTSGIEGDKGGQIANRKQTWVQRIPDVDKHVNEQYFSLGHTVGNNPTLKDEEKRTKKSKKHDWQAVPRRIQSQILPCLRSVEDIKARQEIFPKMKSWEEQHTDLSKNKADASTEVLEGSHLNLTQYELQRTIGFLQKQKRKPSRNWML
ncbi:alpha/beta fold hydrolase [Streptococcus gallinaceus]|uniref:Pimeloyl-ACP methyl ester carboxylesterase n=1 Tax=Streptococcus gallinaceus TaxID=165758 RepID=A0ABV2JL07_9STRE